MTDCRLATICSSGSVFLAPWLLILFISECDTQNKDGNTTADENICSDALLIQIVTQITAEDTAGGQRTLESLAWLQTHKCAFLIHLRIIKGAGLWFFSYSLENR